MFGEPDEQRYDRRGVLAAGAALLAAAYSPRTTSALGAPEAGILRFYDWPDYVSPRTYEGFSKTTRIRIEKAYYASNEALLSRLRSGQGRYDLAAPSGYMVATLAAEGLLRRIDRSKLPNVTRNIDPKFEGLPYDSKNLWSVPKDWGTTGFVYRTDKIKERPTSWREFFALFEKYPKRFTLLDGSDEVIGSVAAMLGYSYSTDDDRELRRVRTFLLELRPFVRAIDSVGYKQAIWRGRAFGGMAWNGDGAAVIAKTPKNAARYVVAKEGGEFWVDAYVIPNGARNPAAAHAWIDFVYQPRWNAEETAYTYYGSPLRPQRLRGQLAQIVLDDPALFPPPATMRRLEAAAISQHGAKVRARIWSDFTR